MTITSPHNAKLKEIRTLHRRRERDDRGRFVAEGEDLLAAADAAGWTPVHRLVAEGSGLAGRGGGSRTCSAASPRSAPAPGWSASTRRGGRSPSARSASRCGASATRATSAP